MTPRRTTPVALGAAALTLATSAATATPAVAQSETQPQSETRPSITLRDRRLNVRTRRHVRVHGVVTSGTRGLAVSLQIRRAGRWRTLARTRTDAGGRFSLRHRMARPMSVRARLRAAGHRTRSLGRVNVYRTALASWYGPGLYGQRLGCGGTLVAGRLGVAHKTLPCGTRVTLRHGGRILRVPVIDRGPYAGAREYDLTEATAQRLGFRGHGAILTTR